MDNIYTYSHVPLYKSGPTEPFLYLWIDTASWIEEHQCHKRYLGIHNGSKGYKYEGGGSDFRIAFKQRSKDFCRIIIMHDKNYEFISEQEENILKLVGAGANTAWYNNQEASWPIVHTESTRRKISLSNKGQIKSENTRAKISAVHKGKQKTKTHRNKISESLKGRKSSDLTKENIRKSAIGRKQSEETINKRSKKYLVISPEGITTEIVNLNKFSKERNLSQAAMSAVARGYNKQHKGWKVEFLN